MAKTEEKSKALLNLDELNDFDNTSTPPLPQKSESAIEEEEEEEEKKTDVRVIDEFGKRKKDREVYLAGLSPELIPPITKKRVATYEMIGKDFENPLTGKPIDLVPIIIPGTFTVFDPFERDFLHRHKQLRYITRQEPFQLENGKTVMRDYVEDIIMSDGFMSVAIDRDYLLYVMMELHPLNESNKWRNRNSGTPPAFRRTDIDRRKYGGNLANMDLAYDAEKAIVELKDPNILIQWATACGIPTSGRPMEGDRNVKYDLRMYARANPKEFFMLNKRNEMAYQLTVLDSIEMGLIEYNPDKRQWLFATDGEKIATCAVNEDPTKALIKRFASEGEYMDKYKKLTDYLNFWE